MITTNGAGGRADRAAERAAWIFYTIAALGSSIGQIWVGATTPPWPAAIPWWIRVVLVLPFAVVIDLGGVVCSAFADGRRRLGEPAHGWRILSAVAVTVAVAINIVGHWHILYLAVVFGSLGTFAYATWLLHAGGRRRDALRAAGKLEDTGAVYPWRDRLREPEVIRRARELVLAHGYTSVEAKAHARQQLRDERRTAALATQVEALIRARHRNPVLATIAVTTLDIDAVAAHLAAHADVAGWARAIGTELVPPTVQAPALPAPADVSPRVADERDEADAQSPASDHDDDDAGDRDGSPDVPHTVWERLPGRLDSYLRWCNIWQQISQTPATNRTAAETHGVSSRTIQHIKAAGKAGLLDFPQPPNPPDLNQANGHRPAPSIAP